MLEAYKPNTRGNYVTTVDMLTETRAHIKILKNHLIHVKYIFDAYEIGMKCISNSLPKSNLSDRNQATYPISIQILSNIYPNRIDFG